MKFKACWWSLSTFYPRPHVLVFEASRDTVDDTWPEACREIWRWLCGNCHLDSPGCNSISVEIFDPDCDRENGRSLGPPEHASELGLCHLCQELVSVTDPKELIRGMFWCFGRYPGDEEGELTFWLTVNYRSDRDWRLPREQMVTLLEEKHLPQITILIEKANPDPILRWQ